VPLERIRDRGVLVVVGGREVCQVDVATDGGGERLPLGPAFREDLGRLGVVLHPLRPGTGQDQVRAQTRVEGPGERGHDARHVLHPIPP
jgi:hypothetical protein